MRIGFGVVVLPFLDSLEGKKTIVDRTTAEVVSDFAFQCVPRIVRQRFFPFYDSGGFKTSYMCNGVAYAVDDEDKLWLYTFEYDLVGPLFLIQRANDQYVGTEDMQPISSEILDDYHENIKDECHMIISQFRNCFNSYFNEDDPVEDPRFMYHANQLEKRLFPDDCYEVVPFYHTLIAIIQNQSDNSHFYNFVLSSAQNALSNCLYFLQYDP